MLKSGNKPMTNHRNKISGRRVSLYIYIRTRGERESIEGKSKKIEEQSCVMSWLIGGDDERLHRYTKTDVVRSSSGKALAHPRQCQSDRSSLSPSSPFSYSSNTLTINGLSSFFMKKSPTNDSPFPRDGVNSRARWHILINHKSTSYWRRGTNLFLPTITLPLSLPSCQYKSGGEGSRVVALSIGRASAMGHFALSRRSIYMYVYTACTPTSMHSRVRKFADWSRPKNEVIDAYW